MEPEPRHWNGSSAGTGARQRHRNWHWHWHWNRDRNGHRDNRGTGTGTNRGGNRGRGRGPTGEETGVPGQGATGEEPGYRNQPGHRDPRRTHRGGRHDPGAGSTTDCRGSRAGRRGDRARRYRRGRRFPMSGRSNHVVADPSFELRGLVALGAGLLWVGASVIPSSPVGATPNPGSGSCAQWASQPVPCITLPSNARQAGTTTQDSVNWAGYAVTGPTVSNVAGSWVQPTATCPKRQNQQAAFWVGIDGYSATDPTVEQIGTDSDCTKGTKKTSRWPEPTTPGTSCTHNLK